jgi:hypothetical protein
MLLLLQRLLLLLLLSCKGGVVGAGGHASALWMHLCRCGHHRCREAGRGLNGSKDL